MRFAGIYPAAIPSTCNGVEDRLSVYLMMIMELSCRSSDVIMWIIGACGPGRRFNLNWLSHLSKSSNANTLSRAELENKLRGILRQYVTCEKLFKCHQTTRHGDAFLIKYPELQRQLLFCFVRELKPQEARILKITFKVCGRKSYPHMQFQNSGFGFIIYLPRLSNIFQGPSSSEHYLGRPYHKEFAQPGGRNCGCRASGG